MGMIAPDEPLLEEEELGFRSHAVVEDLYKKRAEVDLNAEQQARQRGSFEVVVVLKGNFSRTLVDLDEVGLRRVAIAIGGAVHEDP